MRKKHTSQNNKLFFATDQMEIVYVGNRNQNNRALLISNEEWKRLGKILTKKTDEEDAIDASKLLKEMRRETSKKMVDGWDNTELNKTKKLLEEKRKALSELEVQRQQRDEEMKREALKTRNRIIETARNLKFQERDAVKTFNRALQQSEVFKERAIQLNFNKVERENRMGKDLVIAQEQNREAEQYQRYQMDEKQKNNKQKRAKAETLLKELKDREDKRREEEIALYESGIEILQSIAKEIDENREKANGEAVAVKEKLQKDIAENRELINISDNLRHTEEQEEEMVTAIMAETKKLLARARREKEIELTKVKQSALEEMRARVIAWPTKDNGWAKTDIQSAIEVQEQRYRDGLREKKEQMKKKTEFLESGNKMWQEEMAKRREELAQERKWDTERRKREKELLEEYAKLCRTTQLKNANAFRLKLDRQCNDKKAAWLADRQADIARYEAFEQQWHKEDEEFIAYVGNVLEKKKLVGDPIVPLIKTVKDYLEKNNLNLDLNNKVLKKIPKGPVYTSRIIRQIN